MSVFGELLARIWRAYRDAGNGFHPPEAQAKIDTAFKELGERFELIGAQIERRRVGLATDREAFQSDTGNTLRLIDASVDVLKSAVANAARADNVKISRTIVDQSAAMRKAKQQQTADRDMVSQVENVVQQARKDVQQAAELP